MSTPADPQSWSIKPTLTGELVTLRPFVRDDAVAMAAIIADPELIKLTASVATTEAALASPTEPDQRTYDWYGSRSDQDDRLDLGIVDNATGKLVGEVVFNDLDVDANSCNFRTLIGPAGRGRGLGTEAARLILGYGFSSSSVCIGSALTSLPSIRAASASTTRLDSWSRVSAATPSGSTVSTPTRS